MSYFLLKIIPVLAAALMAFVTVRWAYFKILHIAKEKGLVDNPDARKLQKEPVPVMGGIAVFFGIAMGLLAGYTVGGVLEVDLGLQLMPVLAAMVVMLYVGALDDIIGLSPRARFAIEIAAVSGLIFASGGCIDTFHGLWGIEDFSWWVAVPLTIFAGVGIINAMNMVDGVNGLSSSICMLCNVFFGTVFIQSDDVSNAVLAFSMAAALFPFMIHNVFGLRSRMFIGDAGTMVMGILMTWFTICLLRSDRQVAYYDSASGVNMIAFALAVLCVPIFDTLRVMAMRMAKGQNPFHADKTHLHHVFVNVGFSHFFTTVAEVAIMLEVFLSWIISLKFGVSIEGQLYIVILVSMLLVWGMYALLSYHVNRHTELLHRLIAFNDRTNLMRTKFWQRFATRLDAPEDKLTVRLEEAKHEQQPTESEKPIDPQNFKEQDRKKILDYMKGKAEVYVTDIIENSGADKLRVYAILFEEEMKGRIKVIRTVGLGAPEIVAIK